MEKAREYSALTDGSNQNDDRTHAPELILEKQSSHLIPWMERSLSESKFIAATAFAGAVLVQSDSQLSPELALTVQHRAVLSLALLIVSIAAFWMYLRYRKLLSDTLLYKSVFAMGLADSPEVKNWMEDKKSSERKKLVELTGSTLELRVAEFVVIGALFLAFVIMLMIALNLLGVVK